MFSQRLPFHLARNAISDAIASQRDAKLPILDLTESNPTRAGFRYPDGMLSGFNNPESLIYDPSSNGLPGARRLVAEVCGVEPERVILTASSSESYSWLFKLLCDPGDEILTPRPSYPLFEFLAALESVQVRQYPLRYDAGWFIDFAPLEASITERTRAIVVVTPNNPTGSYLKPWELTRLTQICAKHNLAIISDEVFADYDLCDSASLRSLTGIDDVLTFCLGGLSKMVGLPQMKLGWIVAGGPKVIRDEALARIDLIADSYLSVGAPVQYALPQLLAARPSIQSQILERLRANLTWLKEAVGNAGLFRLLAVEGGWYAILQAPRTRTEEEWTLELLSQGVLVQPGYFYDFESEAYLVVSLLTPHDTFREGITRILSYTR